MPVIMKATITLSMLFTILILSEVNGQIDSRFYYKRRYWNKQDGDVVFPVDHIPEEVPEDNTTKGRLPVDKENAIPLEFLEKLDNITDISEFFDTFVAKESIDPKDGIASRFGGENVERSAAVIAKAAGCIPDSTVVPLDPLNPSKDPSIIYFPKCTRVKRCSGCCSSPLLSCQPIETETLTFTILKLQYTGNNRMPLREKEPVLVEQHTKCKCDCRIKKEDCNPYQIYDASQCKCICINYDEQRKCLSEVEKIWDYENCTCRCRETKECTTGTYFDEHQCQCIKVVGSQIDVNTTAFDRKRFIVKAVPVEPDNNTRYDTEG